MTVAIEPELLRIPEVSQLIGLSRAKTYSLIAEGSLGPLIKVGSASRLRLCDVRAWIDAQAKAARTRGGA